MLGFLLMSKLIIRKNFETIDTHRFFFSFSLLVFGRKYGTLLKLQTAPISLLR